VWLCSRFNPVEPDSSSYLHTKLRSSSVLPDRQVAEVHLTLEIVVHPAGVGAATLMAGIGSDSRIPVVDGRERRVLDGTDESAAAAHEEPSDSSHPAEGA
jgi:hypothetical protein